MTAHFPQFDMKMQGFVISGWQITFAFFSPVVVCLQNKIGRKNTLILSVVLEIIAALCFALFSFITNAWAFWIMNFIGRLIQGMADTTTAITVTTIIFCEFPEHADLYYGFIHLAWSGGYIIGPIITLLAYDSIGYIGMFFLLTCMITVGSLVPSIFMIPSRLNSTESESESHD
jgi:MFS family permease